MSIAKTVPEILEQCATDFVPVNVDIELAITAHQQCPSANTLYAVVLARMPTVDDACRQLDYLTRLPHEAWPARSDGAEYREEMLAVIRRNISWRSTCARSES